MEELESESTGSDDQQANNYNDDVDGLDEGVGDISSECEQGTNDLLVDPNDNNNNKSFKEKEICTSDKRLQKHCDN